MFQGHEVFTDSFYTSLKLSDELLAVGIHTTGTLHVDRISVLRSVVELNKSL